MLTQIQFLRKFTGLPEWTFKIVDQINITCKISTLPVYEVENKCILTFKSIADNDKCDQSYSETRYTVKVGPFNSTPSRHGWPS